MSKVIIEITASNGRFWYTPLIGEVLVAEQSDGERYIVHIDDNPQLSEDGATYSIGGFVSGYVEFNHCEYRADKTIAMHNI